MAIYLIVAGGTPSASGLTETGSGLAVDFNVVARQGYVVTIGDGSTNPITVTHNLATRDVDVTVYDAASPFEVVVPDVAHTTTNTCVLTFAIPPTTNQYRVVVTPVRMV